MEAGSIFEKGMGEEEEGEVGTPVVEVAGGGIGGIGGGGRVGSRANHTHTRKDEERRNDEEIRLKSICTLSSTRSQAVRLARPILVEILYPTLPFPFPSPFSLLVSCRR